MNPGDAILLRTLARWQLAARLGCWLSLAGCIASACAEQPTITLGGPLDAGVDPDDDSLVDEQERERVFRELAQRECNEDEPVCGGDGKTYRNYCQALAFGVNVVKSGPC